MEIHTVAANHAANTASLPSRPSAELIENLKKTIGTIQKEIGEEVAAVAAASIREKTLKTGITSISPSERNALLELKEIIEILKTQDNFYMSGKSLKVLLADILANLSEKHSNRAQNPIILLGTICPDYDFEHSTKTYKAEGGLGEGVGLSATTMIKKTMPFVAMLSRHQIACQLNLCYADIEASDPSMLKKVNLAADEFERRVLNSRYQAEKVASRFFRIQGIDCVVKATSMASLVASFSNASTSLREQTLRGIAQDRAGFYRRFFREELGGYSVPQEFFLLRARKDVHDHIVLGRAVADMRKDQERVSLVTLSRPVLANLFLSGLSDQKSVFPVVRLEQSY